MLLKVPTNVSDRDFKILTEALENCPSIQNPLSRNEIIILNLRKEIASKVNMEGNANSIVLSMIRTSLSYSGGLAEVLDVMDLLYENDSSEMQKLRKTSIEMLPEEFADR